MQVANQNMSLINLMGNNGLCLHYQDDEVLSRVSELVQALRGLDEYDRGETMKILKSIGDTYWSYRGFWVKIGDTLADEGFAGKYVELSMVS